MNYHETIIVGAGPAGLQMGYFLAQAQRDYLILEASDRAGAFFAAQPRHRKLLSINKRFNFYPEADFNLRHDWNSLLTEDHEHLFGTYSQELFPDAAELQRYLIDFAAKYALAIQYNTRVAAIARAPEGPGRFVLTDTHGTQYTCARLLMATGALMPYIPDDIEGIELAEGYEVHEIDPLRFENKRVAIIGRGNAAFEVANHLAGHAALIHIYLGNKRVKHAWQTHFPGDLRAINNTVLDMYQLKSLHASLGAAIKKVTRRADGTFALLFAESAPHWKTPGTLYGTLIYDHVIRCTGWKYVDVSLFAPDMVPAVDAKSKYPVLSACWESSVPDLFFLGTVTAARERKAASSFIHGFRYSTRTLFHLLEARYHGVPVPVRTLALRNVEGLEALAEGLIQRLSTTSALYQLFGVMCDVLVLTPGEVQWFSEWPVDYVLEQPEFIRGHEYVIMTLEYGFQRYPAGAIALDFIYPSDPADDACSAFLHPVFRHYVEGTLVNEFHLGESLVTRYRDDYTLTEIDAGLYNKHSLMNFLNKLTRITTQEFSLDHTVIAPDVKFDFWAADDPRLQDHGIAGCLPTTQMQTHSK